MTTGKFGTSKDTSVDSVYNLDIVVSWRGRVYKQEEIGTEEKGKEGDHN